jgi:Pyruvate/2-oxoacid:ferredoxin oxidoreductase gamma subunit
MIPVFPLGVFRDKKETTSGKPVPPKAPASSLSDEAIHEVLDITEKEYFGRKTTDERPRYLNPRIKMAGFGGQGILFIGVILADAGMRLGRKVSWLPSYGPEMRGGTANCHVIISETQIGSPLISEADVLIAMNRPSLEKFQADVRPGGLVLYDKSLISDVEMREDLETLAVPATEIADKIGNTKVANVVMLGALLGFCKTMPDTAILSALNDKVGRPGLAELNEKALRAGKEYVVKNEWKNGAPAGVKAVEVEHG